MTARRQRNEAKQAGTTIRLIAERIADLGSRHRLRAGKAVSQWISQHVVVDDEPDVLPGGQIKPKTGVNANIFRHVVILSERYQRPPRVE